MSSTTYTHTYVVPLQPDGLPLKDLPTGRILYSPRNIVAGKPIEVPGSDFTFSHYSVLQSCHVIIVAVNATDTSLCCKKLAEVLFNVKDLTIFSLQRGVRSSTIVRDTLGSRPGLTVVEGFVSFAVIKSPRFNGYLPTIPTNAVFFERLTPEASRVANGPLNLIESTPLTVYYRKVLTPFSWGILIFENLYALNILTRGSLSFTVSKRKWRLILAMMVRESVVALMRASRGGAWKPDLMGVSTWLTPFVLEMMLILPQPLFAIGFYFAVGSLSDGGQGSPGQQDLSEGRKTMIDAQLGEIVELVLTTIADVESAVIRSGPSAYEQPIIDSRSGGNNYLQALEQQYDALMVRRGGHATQSEAMFWIIRITAVVSIILLLLFLFMHDY
eukprot:gene24512-32971_t